MAAYAILAVIALLGVVYVGGTIVASRFVSAKSKDTKRKHQPYECGIEPIGSARIRFKIGYYLFALVFMVFDVEALFLFPCLKIFSNPEQYGLVPWQVLAELGVFVFILWLGLMFAWKKKVLEWR